MANSSSGTQAANKSRLRKPLFWLLLLIMIAAAAGTYYWWNKAHTKPRYVTAEVSQGDVERSVNVTGSINPRTTVQVGSYVSGTVKTLSCDYNTQVKAGQVCATIDPSTFQVAVDQAAAQLNSSKAQLHKDEAALVYAKGVFDRDTKLLKDGVVAQEVADNDKNVFKQATSQIDLDKASIVAAEANLKSAEVNLGYTKIISPVTGTVLTRSVDVGQTVASSLQTPTLFLIGKDLTKMQVDANVSEADVGRIKVDQDVSFSVQAYPDKTFEGKVKQIRRGPITVQNVVTYDVVVSVDNPELLLFPGMTADAEIVTDARENVKRVPLAATRFTPDGMHGGGDTSRAATETGNESPRRGTRHDGAASADNSKAASSAATSSAVTARPPAQTAHRSEHDGQAREGHGRGQWQGRGGQGGGTDEERAERRRNWINAHPEMRGERGEHGGNGEHRHHHHDEEASADAATDNSDSTNNKPDTAKTQKASQQAPAKQDQPAEAGETLTAPSAPPAPPPRKRARVWVMRDGNPVPVWITIGLDDGEMVEVLEGDLKPGDKVIVNEIRPVESVKSAAVQSPFGQTGGRGGMGGLGGGNAGGKRRP